MHKIDNLNNKNLNVSNSAVNQFIKILSDEQLGSFVRLSVESGGCSGFSYKFTVDRKYDKVKDIKLAYKDENIIFVTDLISIGYLENSLIDWKETLSNSQFVIENPLAKSKCGCGTSFSV